MEKVENAGITVLCERSKTEPFENNDAGLRHYVVQPLFKLPVSNSKQIWRTSKWICFCMLLTCLIACLELNIALFTLSLITLRRRISVLKTLVLSNDRHARLGKVGHIKGREYFDFDQDEQACGGQIFSQRACAVWRVGHRSDVCIFEGFSEWTVINAMKTLVVSPTWI